MIKSILIKLNKVRGSVLLILAITLFAGCQDGPDANDALILNINPTRAKTLEMEEWFSRIELTPLETTPESIFAQSDKVIFHQGRFYILDRTQNALFIFNELGKFIFNTKALMGSGPGEYFSILDFNINPTTNQIEILDPPARRIKFYDLNCEFLNQIYIEGIFSLSSFSRLTSDLFAFYTKSLVEYDGNLVIYSIKEEKVIKRLAPLSASANKLASISSYPFSHYNGNIFFKHKIPSNSFYLVDTVKLDLIEYMNLNYGKYNFPISKLPEGKERKFYNSYMRSNSEKYAFPINTIETANYIYQFFNFESRINIARYIKSSGEVAVRYCDLGSMEQLKPTDFSRGDTLFSVHSPNNLRYYLNEELLDNETMDIISSIRDSDNPVIVKYFSQN